MSEKFRLDRKIDFQNTFYTKCINVIIDSIGPSIILRSIVSEYDWENTTITNCRQIHGILRKSHTTITRHQEDKAKQLALSSPSR